jgi:hypothetical protein
MAKKEQDAKEQEATETKPPSKMDLIFSKYPKTHHVTFDKLREIVEALQSNEAPE